MDALESMQKDLIAERIDKTRSDQRRAVRSRDKNGGEADAPASRRGARRNLRRGLLLTKRLQVSHISAGRRLSDVELQTPGRAESS
jgi:hypothetical protein